MSGADSTEAGPPGPTALEQSAAGGELPAWARVTQARRDHLARVARLMKDWAGALSLPPPEATRWEAAGWLHDSLRDAEHGELLAPLSPAERELPPKLLHGPAAAALLDGQVDRRLADAVRFHTTGHPGLDTLGRALYAADFLDPGRDFLPEWRAELRARMPHELDAVVLEIAAARLAHLLERRLPIRPETTAFWSDLITAETA